MGVRGLDPVGGDVVKASDTPHVPLGRGWGLVNGELCYSAAWASEQPARDAGDRCDVCGGVVTWVDHLPPAWSGGSVRCYAGRPGDSLGVVSLVDRIHRREQTVLATRASMREEVGA